MKRIALALLGLTMALALAGCATVNGENSFQSQAPQEVTVSQTATDARQAQPADTETVQPVETGTQDATQPTPTPSPEPDAGGYNG